MEERLLNNKIVLPDPQNIFAVKQFRRIYENKFDLNNNEMYNS